MHKFLIAAAALAAITSTASAKSACLYESEQLAPVYVLGTLVQPQSNIIVMGNCESDFESLDQSYTATYKRRIVDHLQAAESVYAIHCESHLSATSKDATLDANCK